MWSENKEMNAVEKCRKIHQELISDIMLQLQNKKIFTAYSPITTTYNKT